jgi:uncharacterized protein (DUF1778 family)
MVDVMTKPERTKSERIDVRTTPAVKKILQEAAAASHKSVSDFVLEKALIAADEALANRRFFELSAEKWAEFQEALDRPVQNKPNLKKLLSEPGVFD